MEIKMPSLGEGVNSGTVSRILVSEGDAVDADQELIEIESDKAAAALPSPSAGTISKILVKEGQDVSEGDVLAQLDESEDQEKPEKEGKETNEKEEEDTEREQSSSDESDHEKPRNETIDEPPADDDNDAPASPSVKRTALNLGIDLRKIKGSGNGGRVEMKDMKAWVDQLRQNATKQAPKAAPLPDFTQYGEILRKPLSSIRRTIAQRMTESCQTIPQVTQFGAVDTTSFQKTNEQFKSENIKLTPTVFLLKILPPLLKKHPHFNASFDAEGDEIVLKEYCHIGIATATERGLVVPVIRDADHKSTVALAEELETLAKQARSGELDAEAMSGGSFTLSNQGGVGGDAFTPVINPPESAILGVGRSKPRAVVVNNEIVVREMMPLALTYDHRVADGAQAAQFMEELLKAIENFDAAKLQDEEEA